MNVTGEMLIDYLGYAPENLNLNKLLNDAVDLVDYYIGYQKIPSAMIDRVNKAVCAQVEYWIEVGESADIVGGTSSVSLGQFSMTSTSSDGVIPALAPRARRYLYLTGLLHRNVILGEGDTLATKFFTTTRSTRL